MECSLQEGIVQSVRDFPGRQEITVRLQAGDAAAINYPALSGYCETGDRVVLNTTAQELALGTGGWHYVLAIWGRKRSLAGAKGHILKLRYTPLQGRVLSVEEEASPHHRNLARAQGLAALPVAAGGLHSMLAPFAFALSISQPQSRLVYLMSDGGALPLAFSRIVPILKKESLLAATITFGHAFGGDYEAVNVYSALLAAKHVAKADLALVAMGPGVVGTNTKWGTTSLEQGLFLNAALHLGGTPLIIPRLSEGDQRARHFGISHHTLTVLEKIVQEPVELPLPFYLQSFPGLAKQAEGLKQRLSWQDTEEAFSRLLSSSLPLKTMGRGPGEDALFFHGVLAAGLRAGQLVQERRERGEL